MGSETWLLLVIIVMFFGAEAWRWLLFRPSRQGRVEIEDLSVGVYRLLSIFEGANGELLAVAEVLRDQEWNIPPKGQFGIFRWRAEYSQGWLCNGEIFSVTKSTTDGQPLVVPTARHAVL